MNEWILFSEDMPEVGDWVAIYGPNVMAAGQCEFVNQNHVQLRTGHRTMAYRGYTHWQYLMPPQEAT